MRKLFLAIIVSTLLFKSLALASEKNPHPNIIFILFDDLGYGEPPAYRGNSPFKMPTLDRLAREGMRFTDAHTPSAVCTPTRYGVLTGRYPMRIGQFGVLGTYSTPIIERERLTAQATGLSYRGVWQMASWHELGHHARRKEIKDRNARRHCGDRWADLSWL